MDTFRVIESVAFVIFGVTGDLTKRKLLPALYELSVTGRLNDSFHIIGFARRDWDADVLRQTIRDGVNEFSSTRPIDDVALNRLLSNVHYIRSSFNESEGYDRLCQKICDLGVQNILFYLATPPESYVDIIRLIGRCKANRCKDGWVRIVIEKPYGQDLSSALLLEKEVHDVFEEHQVYRIDHYLGKETVQNILVFRYANGIFEPIWNRNFIDSVQITVAETVGVGSRAGYYETSGVVRDVFQNHMLQLLTLTAMDAPVAFNADAVRDEKVKVLRALRPMQGKEVISNTYRAQYTSGMMDGKRVPGYKDEGGVAPSSTTETFMAARLYVDNWRWSGVPFYLRSGKRLPKRLTEIAIKFRQPPLSLFNWKNMAGEAPNLLVLNVQPDEGITLTFGAKSPGPVNQIAPVKMDFSYHEAFGGEPPEAYERLLLDSLLGDATLFTRSDEVYSAWAYTTKILDGWRENPVKNLPVYEAGTWGPPGADDFIGRDGRLWHNPTD